jgi:hypothetical protein
MPVLGNPGFADETELTMIDQKGEVTKTRVRMSDLAYGQGHCYHSRPHKLAKCQRLS